MAILLDPDALDFLSPPPEYLQLKCPICFELLLESPNLVSCCGNHVCGACIKTLGRQPCPICKALIYERVLNKGHQRAVASLKVRCLNKEKGCQWTGEVKQVQSHLSQNDGNCQYQLYDCKYKCGKNLFRSPLTDHENNGCVKRPIICRYCNKYHSTYEDVTSEHYKVCPLYPVLCPNHCGNNVKRIELDTHTSTHCPQRKVNCEFVGIGCKWFDSKGKLEAHLESNWRAHIAFAMSHSTDEINQLKKNVSKLNKEVEELKKCVEVLEPQASGIKSNPLSIASSDEETCKLADLPSEDCSVTIMPGKDTAMEECKELASNDENEYPEQFSVASPVDDDKLLVITSKGTMEPITIPDPAQRCTASLIVDRWHHKRSFNNLHRAPSFRIPELTLHSLYQPYFNLQVTVHCNGISNGKGSHVSVSANVTYRHPITSEEFFSGKLLILLQSPIPDYENKCGLIIFDDSIDERYRKPSPDTVELTIEKFVSFDEVDCYLRPPKDSLLFKIYYLN